MQPLGNLVDLDHPPKWKVVDLYSTVTQIAYKNEFLLRSSSCRTHLLRTKQKFVSTWLNLLQSLNCTMFYVRCRDGETLMCCYLSKRFLHWDCIILYCSSVRELNLKRQKKNLLGQRVRFSQFLKTFFFIVLDGFCSTTLCFTAVVIASVMSYDTSQ